jgi:hypothetical protein
MSDIPDFTAFREQWLEEITSGEPSAVEKGRRFAHKLITQWRDTDVESAEIHYCDGAGDGGIDAAYLHRGEALNPEAPEGDTWYLVQSKYGSAFTGPKTLLFEGQKVIETLDGRRSQLSSLVGGLLERITNFRASASELDRIILVYATVEPLRTYRSITSLGLAA